MRLNCSETISHREKSEVGNETLDLGLQDILILFCYNLITFDSAAHLKWTNPTEKMALTHLWNETLVLILVSYQGKVKIIAIFCKTLCSKYCNIIDIEPSILQINQY